MRQISNLVILIVVLAWPLAQVQAQEYVPGEVLVKLKEDANIQQTYSFFGKAQSEKEMVLKNSFGKMNMYHFSLKPGQNIDEVVNELKKDPAVQYAEPNYIFRKATVGETSQKFTYDQIQDLAQGDTFVATSAQIDSLGTCVNDPVAGNERPIVAVIDTGLDVNHQALVDSDAIWKNSAEIAGNGIDDDNNGYIDDVNGWNFVSNSGAMIDDDSHGTHVTGIILSVCHDIFTGPFAQSKVRVMPLKFLDGYGVGKTSDAIKAIYYAVNNGATVLNNSWGGPSYSGALHEAIVFAYGAGVSFVAAAGNAGSDNDSAPMYPANYDVPNIISVAATTNSDSLAWFSNFGPSSVHLGSPGVSVMSTIPETQYGELYGSMSGTSMATPFVAGAAAMMVFEAPGMLGYQVKSILFQEADASNQLVGKVSTESRLDAGNSINSAKSATVSADQPSYAFTNQDRELASDLASGGCGLVTKVVNDFTKNQRGGGGGAGAPQTWYVLLIIGLLSLPVIVYNVLRARDPSNRREHERFNIDSRVTVAFGERQLVGSISTISQGGVQLNTDALLDNGGIVSMKICSPDGQEQIEVEGQIVWSEARSSYGVRFANAKPSVAQRISLWTKGLSKAV